ncbi:T9SS type A sorting domain-containing protein [Hymenobacter properus]|uniref:T9SS type A sorting domain-containing protein n=1 Tax=Hymenobacter properus TaxID=2791026 RepID=A0A931FKD4_9BACT|nr:T9SS type A sorting domain-containing protein [Hymenobacter properus]MBF9140881.1 T9SS type A sorting domain-containing protein [Hymenobacter properus]MBR7719690.1 T9SS type A sorting domain-containing protein [Microvirga sp. SRT04]
MKQRYTFAQRGRIAAGLLFLLLLLAAPGAWAQSRLYYTQGSSTATLDAAKAVNPDGTAGATLASNATSFAQPTDVAVDPAGGFLYVADQYVGTGGILRFTTAGGSRTQIVAPIAGATYNGLALDVANNLLYFTQGSATDPTLDALKVVNLTTRTVTTLASGAANFTQPTDLALDATGGFLYVADQYIGTGRILRFTTAGANRTSIVAPTAGADYTGLALDAAGSRLYFAQGSADPTLDALKVVNLSTNAVTTLASGATNFTQPTDLALDAANNQIYVADQYTGTGGILRFTTAGGSRTQIVAPLAGTTYNGLALAIAPPTVTTMAATSIATNSAVLGGNVTADGGGTVTGRGVVYSVTSTNGTPTIGGSGVTQAANGTGTGTFSATIAGLTPGTNYSVRAYATNSAGTSYGAVQTFTTAAVPVATAQNVTLNLAANGTATLNASSVNNGSTGSGTLTYTIQKIVYGKVNENQTLTLTTPNGANFTQVRFASYGTPNDNGNGNYTLGSCNAANSLATAQNSFSTSRSTGSMDAVNAASANNNPILNDPCLGTPKSLAVQAGYSADAASLSYDCAEANKTQYVLLTVTDGSGNVSTATAQVTVNPPPTATLTGLSPNPATPGTTITATGTNLSGVTSVTLGGTPVTVSNLSATGFQFVVPASANSGNVVASLPCSQTLTSTFTVTSQAPVVTAPANGSLLSTTTPIYTGTAPANSTVTVYVDGSSPGTTTATAGGSFSLTQPTPLTDGSHTVYATALSSGRAVSVPSATNTFTVDATAPTVTLSSATVVNGGATTTSPVTFTAQFSESVGATFTSGDITLSSGSSVSSFVANSTPANSYTFTVTPAVGAVSVSIAAGVAQDAAGNGNTAATPSPYTFTYSLPAATVQSVTGLTPSPTATATVDYRVVFSGAVTGLSTANFNLTTSGLSGASITSVSGSGTTYTVTVNTGSGDGTLRLNVFSSTGVTPTISNVPYTSGTTYTITKSFLAAPTLSIVGTGGTGTDVTAFVDVVQVLSGGTAFANALQNPSFETHGPYNNGGNTFSYATSGAVWAFNALAGIADQGSAFTPVTPIPNGIAVAFVQSNSLANGQLQQNLAVPTGSNYQVSFQTAQRNCCTTGDQALNVFLNGVFLGNIQPRNIGVYQTFTSAAFSVTAPALTATVSGPASPTSTSPIPFAVSFSQSVGSTFTAADVTVTGGTLTGGSFSGSGAGPYTFTVTPSGTGTVSVSVAAGVATDANNTGNAASNTVSVQFQAPTITVNPATVPGGSVGVAYSQIFLASGGTAPYTYAITAGAVPAGLSLSSGGTLSGTPTASGTFNFRVTATDNSAAPGPYSGFRDYALTIAAPTSVVWNGSQSTDWYTPANWTPNVVPTISLDATVPAGVPNMPAIGSGTASARSLTLNSGATLNQSGGTLDVRADLTNNGSFNATGGTVVLGTTAQTNGPNLLGSSRLRFWNLTVNSNGVLLSTSAGAAVQRLLTLNGAFVTQGNAFVLESDAAGTALVVNSSSAGFVFGQATVQRYIAPDLNPGLGYRHYSAPVGLATVGSLATGSFTPVVNPAYNNSATPTLVSNFPTVYGYDQSRLATTNNNLNAFDKGWYSPTSLADPLTVGQGYTVNLAANQTLNLNGPLNNGNVTLNLARNSGATAPDAGWALVGNPYPAPLDYTQVAPADRPGLDAAIYVFESTSQYAGTYRASVNGVGGNANSPNSLLAQGQGFFVRVSNGQTSGSLTFRNSQRLTSYTSPVYHRTVETRPLVQLDLQGAGQADPVYVYFENGATPGVDRELDAVKLPNSHGLNVSAETGAQRLAIDALPALGTATVVVPLTVGVPAAGSFSFNTTQLLNLGTTPVYLRDLLTGAVVDLRAQPRYQFTVSNAAALITGRFELVFSPQAVLSTASAALTAQVVVYPNPASKAVFVELPAALGRLAVTAALLDAVGRVVVQRVLPAGGTTHTLPLTGLATGVYSLRLQTQAGVVVKKLVVE